jgi:hypothetical protein
MNSNNSMWVLIAVLAVVAFAIVAWSLIEYARRIPA